MKIYFGCDHAGFELKNFLIEEMKSQGYDIEDLGAHAFDPGDDYPDYVIPVAKKVAEDPDNRRGIILGGSGQGEAMAANRIPNVRAVVFNGQYIPLDGRDVPQEIVTSREHNNSNVLSLGARFISPSDAKEAVETWLKTPFSGDERHIRRLRKIEEMTS